MASEARFESGCVPVLPLKELVVFPGSVAPILVVRDVSLTALEQAVSGDKRVFVVCQKDLTVEIPGPGDLHAVGTVAEIIQILKLPDGSAKVLVEGQWAARGVQYSEKDGYLQGFVALNQVTDEAGKTIEAQQRTALASFERYAELSERVPADLMSNVRAIRDSLAFVYAVASNVPLKIEEKQEILESNSLEEKFILLNQYLDEENQIAEIESKIDGQVKSQIGKSQREYYLNEQLKAIERELGIGAEDDPDLQEIASAINECGMPDEVKTKAERELGRLSRMPAISPEAAVTRTWLEWLTDMPWVKASEDRIELAEARRVLDADHYGLKKVKERILEFLAVVKHAGPGRGPILCFVGPPGVGKTSLGQSIARCTSREFVRISLGGVRDEAEIRGHRRTYVGSLPGKIIQSMKRAGVVNPVFLLDEIDKMSSDFRGDPSAALLEVLDPEQNKSFVDHYLEVDYSLSRVMFIATANTVDGIPYPLLDRMELIHLPGYTEEEKRHIAARHLLPRQRVQHGLKARQVSISTSVMRRMISDYTREAGVRNLERTLAQICRKVTRAIVETPRRKPGPISMDKVREFLGPPRFQDMDMDRRPEVGTATGLAWTEAGGELLPVEVTLMKGKGLLQLTGKLGEVMQESAKAALSWIRSHAADLGVDPDCFESIDIHVHVPEGAIPKDGPSAGITIATSMASALAGLPVRQDIAMTGEVTLRGRVLRIGGLKEKALAARRRGISHVVIPKGNVLELEEIQEVVGSRIKFVPVELLTEVLEFALVGLVRKSAAKGSPHRGERRRTSVSPRTRAH